MSTIPEDRELADGENRREIVRIEGLCKRYGSFEVLHDIHLTVRRGEKIVICGPSGSGKSTLIRCLNKLEDFHSGTVEIDGVPLDMNKTNIDTIRREVGMVFQSFNLFPHLSVLENCTLAPRLILGLSEDEAIRRAKRYLERVRISNQILKYPGQLSGGQQQRVAIARALCMMPRLMLFDEPTSALDPEVVSEVLEVMEDLANDGMTMICVTHEMGFARRIADRVIFINEGRIVEEAPPSVFFTQPASERARAFLSQIHFH
jgi:general L-amino acid transport system ATP-binding protein